MPELQALSADKLRRRCDSQRFEFKSTEELSSLDEVIGQDRAVRAVSFGIDIESPGYHIYALGSAGTGKTTTIKRFLERKAQGQPVPDDWLYLNDFDDPDKPKALRLRAGLGCELKADMDQLVEELETEVPRAFEGEQYQREQEKIQEALQEKRQALFRSVEAKAQEENFRLMQTPQGIAIAPVIDDEVVTQDQFNQLDRETRERVERTQEELQDELREAMRGVQRLQQEAKERVKQLDREVVGFAVGHLIDDLKGKYANHEAVVDHLEAVRADILDQVPAFKQAQQMAQAGPQQQAQMMAAGVGTQPGFEPYRANLVVDHCDAEGAPVVLETHPSFQNLVGRVEHEAQFGALVTDFTMLKGGALHRANGGYLMVEARDILTQPFAWEALKRALKNGEIQVTSMGQESQAIATRTLEPEPIPLDIKIVVVGDPRLYYLLYQLDDDFQELFKVKADFAERTDWHDEALDKYARFIGTTCREEGLRHFAPDGVARVIEQSARSVAHQRKLGTKFAEVVDLVRQASYWAGSNGHDLVDGADVQRAVDEKEFRSNRVEERFQEMIQDGTILIDTQGEVVGQVNGISVVPLGDHHFGKPARITARTHAGTGGLVHIDREAKLGGRVHNKGALILSGYLGGRYAQDAPLSLSAHLAFEQLYEEVDGDSAASAELYALLSSLSQFPLRQDLAVTGSVNQHGQVQAIGGVNEKIEGFFCTCQHAGLTGTQGVLIPRDNVQHLMLREQVVSAVERGDFHIYPVSSADEGIALLTGRAAGEPDDAGAFPEGSVNRAVRDRLRALAEAVQAEDEEDR